MTPAITPPPVSRKTTADPSTGPTLFVNEVRLGPRQWALAAVIILLVGWLTPLLWTKLERFDTGPDYRIPYSLSKDYWLYRRRIEETRDPSKVIVIGDSVVWGEYVLPDGTLSHFLGQEAGASNRFINAGVNGLFPIALDGLIQYYGEGIEHRKVILQCNLLWMSSPKTDLSTTKEEKFNHPHLVPQFRPIIPCYRADANERLSAVAERNLNLFAWLDHLQNAYFGGKSILAWTMQDDGAEPPHYPNSYRNPLAQITFRVPQAPADDPDRGPRSPRHRPWTASGSAPTTFEWVSLDASLQWRAFQHLVGTLRARGNDLLIVLGPFNRHMIAPDSLPPFEKLNSGVATWLAANQIPVVIPELLPSDLYADASHPLTAGYRLLAERVAADPVYVRWLAARP